MRASSSKVKAKLGTVFIEPAQVLLSTSPFEKRLPRKER